MREPIDPGSCGMRAPVAPPMALDDVHVWVADLSDPRVAPVSPAGLSQAELARAMGFMRCADRDLFVLAHVMLREALGGYLQIAPSEVTFQLDTHGKPRLAARHGSDLTFNLAHSGTSVILGMTRGHDIGVDIEAVVSHSDLLDLAEDFFAPDEYLALRERSDGERVDLFYALWTRKEAYLKARGTGLSFPLCAFSVLDTLGAAVSPTPIRTPPADTNARWFCWGVAAPTGHAAAVVLAGKPSKSSSFRWTSHPAGAIG